MNIKGEVVRVFPSDTNTDEIISGKYKYDELDLNKLAKHTFESIDSHFYEDCQGLRNPILVAAANFGCGSSREQAPQVLKACGISCILSLIHISEPTRRTPISYAVFCLKKKKNQ